MNEDTLKGRRQVHPLESHPASLKGWTLSFRMLGMPYLEPGFATIERVTETSTSSSSTATANSAPATGAAPAAAAAAAAGRWRSEVHGVVHRVRAADWVQIMATEGVGRGSSGYRVVEVEVSLYDGRRLRALTLEGQAASLHSAGRPVAPSRRYLELLRTGARHHGLDPAYIAYLDSLQPFDGSSLAARLGRAAAIGFVLPLALPLVPPMVLQHKLRKRAREAQLRVKGGSSGSSNKGDSSDSGSGVVAAAKAAASAAKDASDLPSKAAAAATAAAPLPPVAASVAVTAAADAAGTAAAPPPPGGRLPPELVRPPMVLPSVVNGYLMAVQYAAWAAHDLLAAPVLGSGSAAAGGSSSGGRRY